MFGNTFSLKWRSFIFYTTTTTTSHIRAHTHTRMHMHMRIRIDTKVCDRYCYSGVAFSAAKGMDIEWCKACDKGLIAPDCVIYLDMPVEEAAQVSQLRLYWKVFLHQIVDKSHTLCIFIECCLIIWFVFYFVRSLERKFRGGKIWKNWFSTESSRKIHGVERGRWRTATLVHFRCAKEHQGFERRNWNNWEQLREGVEK